MKRRKLPPRCPACKSHPDRYVEMWTGHSIDFPSATSGFPETTGYLSEGNPYKVFAVCNCGRKWTLRGVGQITDLRE